MSKTARASKQNTNQLQTRDKHQRLRQAMQGHTTDGLGLDKDSTVHFLHVVDPDSEIEELPELYETFLDELGGGGR